ncbi:NAD(P)-dependent dehydrogenase, short-chain alcohol dehydrogenase family [Polaromonas sp. OV174]|uniref:SDR family NAD(P)-dependent oxidoreductase n=1 Tax=Polaromonas sp. OV174 TaxID=1855300 RepID=UPI0008E7F3A8|nr:SDR family NAD(P)-dependent oxidoreductase [Polaromonas sp. OV174]SFC52524.1 NAD(P)-dependent dehydrogenase, short-chain alcohol dehydrogenase family [Polaromonas sp. OV174]
MKSIRFDGRVAVITGAGGGLGRAHALLLAERGATVVVNDLGGSVGGVSGDATAAQKVVREIEDAGGRALPNYDDIATPDGAQRLIDVAMQAFGRVDVLINNAGILRDKTLHKMDPADFEAVVRVHLLGSAWCSRAALPVMQQQQYGRIVMTTSAAGLYGNFGQSNYGAAKLGVVGLMNTLKHEGEKFGIRVNTVAPVALTRMTEGVPLGRLLSEATPERVAAGVAFLASEACGFTGQILSAGGGYFSTVRIVESRGLHAPAEEVSPEFVANHWASISDVSNERAYDSATDALLGVFGPSQS